MNGTRHGYCKQPIKVVYLVIIHRIIIIFVYYAKMAADKNVYIKYIKISFDTIVDHFE